MKRELKWYEFVCDDCGEETIVKSAHNIQVPPEWRVSYQLLKTPGNHLGTVHYCPPCTENRMERL